MRLRIDAADVDVVDGAGKGGRDRARDATLPPPRPWASMLTRYAEEVAEPLFLEAFHPGEVEVEKAAKLAAAADDIAAADGQVCLLPLCSRRRRARGESVHSRKYCGKEGCVARGGYKSLSKSSRAMMLKGC